MANCTICGEPIILVPSATARAKKYGGKPSDYEGMFTTHVHCLVDKRQDEVRALMAKYRENPSYGSII